MKPMAGAGEPGQDQTSPAKLYALPDGGFSTYRNVLVLQLGAGGVLLIGLAVVAHYAIPGVDWSRVAGFSGLVVLGLAAYLPLLIRRQKQLWQQVRVELSDRSVAVYQGAGPLPDLRLAPQRQARVDRDQIAGITQTSYGLVIAARYDPRALVIPNRLAPADYQEIIAALSRWCTVPGGPDMAESLPPPVATFGAVNRPGPDGDQPHLYSRPAEVLPVGVIIGVMAGTIPAVFAVTEWVRNREVATDLAWVILIAFLVNLFVMLFGIEIAFAWVDYGLARVGVSQPARASFWFAIGSAIFIFALALAVGSNPVAGLVITAIGTVLVGALYWIVRNARSQAQPVFESSQAIAPDPLSSAAPANCQPGTAAEGAYRLTFAEYLRAVWYFTESRPRFYGKPFLLSALLPRSVDRDGVQAAFSAHPRRNKVLAFAADDDSIRWRIDGSQEITLDWDRVKKLVWTRKGLILCEANGEFDWLPFHAFDAKDGPTALVELARRHTAYSHLG